jgi:hypothetical protein
MANGDTRPREVFGTPPFVEEGDPFERLLSILTQRQTPIAPPAPTGTQGFLSQLLPAIAEAASVGMSRDPGAALGQLSASRREAGERRLLQQRDIEAQERARQQETTLRVGLEKIGQQRALEREARDRRFQTQERVSQEQFTIQRDEARAREALLSEQRGVRQQLSKEQRQQEMQKELVQAQEAQQQKERITKRTIDLTQDRINPVPVDIAKQLAEVEEGVREMTPAIKAIYDRFITQPGQRSAKLDRALKQAQIFSIYEAARRLDPATKVDSKLEAEARKTAIRSEQFFTKKQYFLNPQDKTVIADDDMGGFGQFQKSILMQNPLSPEENMLEGRRRSYEALGGNRAEFDQMINLTRTNPQVADIVRQSKVNGISDREIINDLKLKGAIK